MAISIAFLCERNEVFQRGQFGYCRGRGTSEAVAQLGRKSRESLEREAYSTALALLLDIEEKSAASRPRVAGVTGAIHSFYRRHVPVAGRRTLDTTSISFVDDIELVIDGGELGKDTKQLECIAEDAMQWDSDNRVELEVSKTEVCPSN